MIVFNDGREPLLEDDTVSDEDRWCAPLESDVGDCTASGVDARRFNMLEGRGMKAESRLLAFCRSSVGAEYGVADNERRRDKEGVGGECGRGELRGERDADVFVGTVGLSLVFTTPCTTTSGPGGWK